MPRALSLPVTNSAWSARNASDTSMAARVYHANLCRPAGQLFAEVVGDVVVGGDSRRHAISDRRRDLAGGVRPNVAGGVESGQLRLHPLVHRDVAALVQLQQAVQELDVWVLADEDED